MVQHKMYRNTQIKSPESNQLLDATSGHAMQPETCCSQNNKQHQRQKGSFFQLTGHKECFKPGKRPNTILKRATGNEQQCLMELMEDELAPFVPHVYGLVSQEEEEDDDDNHNSARVQHNQPPSYVEMQDLLATFCQASVMDVKMGCRTYREQELDSASKEAKLREDMFEKMVEVDEGEPTAQERQARAVTKPRYMIWRETVSSTASLSFRIEGMRLNDGTIDKNFKTTKDEEQIAKAFMRYAKSKRIRFKYLERLYDLRKALVKSNFFRTHEMIGSSLLFVHDDHEASIWMIDFAKTYLLPDETRVTHMRNWEVGNHEDGYLTGVDNLIRIFQTITARSVSDNRESSSDHQITKHIRRNIHDDDDKHTNNNSYSNKIAMSAAKHHTAQKLSTGVNAGNGSNGSLNTTARFLPKLKT